MCFDLNASSVRVYKLIFPSLTGNPYKYLHLILSDWDLASGLGLVYETFIK